MKILEILSINPLQTGTPKQVLKLVTSEDPDEMLHDLRVHDGAFHLGSVSLLRQNQPSEMKEYVMCRSRGGTGGPDPPPHPLENHKNIGFLCNTGPDHLKNHKATKLLAFNVELSSAHQQNAIWAIIGLPAKHHLNGVSLASQ